MVLKVYKDGALVLAKVKGYPPWPAEVKEPEKMGQKARHNRIFVFFFQPRQIKFCLPQDVVPFAGEAREAAIARTQTKGCNQDFKQAVADALKEEQSRPDAMEEEEEEEEEEAEDGGEEDGEEEMEAQDVTPAQGAKKRQGTGTKSTSQKRPRAEATEKEKEKGKPPRQKAKKSVASEDSDGLPLFEVLKTKRGSAVAAAARAWVTRYEANGDEAIADLLACLFQSCGSHYKVEVEEPLSESDVDDVVAQMVEAAKAGDLEDHLGAKSKEAKVFKQNLEEFWDALVGECQEDILFDGRLFDKIMDYVIALACTAPRSFRHAATVVGLQLVTSYVGLALSLGEVRDTQQRQLNAEVKKRADGPRVQALTKSLGASREKVAQVEDMMRKLFTGVFMHRYRDIDADIRAACITSLGAWIESYPSLFLHDLYLKYTGWMLNDKNASVRLAAVSALCDLYANEENVPALGLFTERFMGRMLELADDIDIHVAIKSLGLLQQLQKHGLLPEEELAPLYELLIDESPEVRQAAGELVYEHRIAQVAKGGKGGSSGASSRPQLRKVLEIVTEYRATPALALYVVDALWETTEALQDWGCMAKMLLSDGGDELSDTDATSLVQVLGGAVSKAVGDKIVPSGSVASRRAALTKAQREAQEASRNELTSALMKPLPQMLRKFMADPAKVASLADIVVQLDLELFSIKRQEASFSTLLQLLREGFFKHGDEGPLRSCMRALAFCAEEGHAELRDAAQHALADVRTELLAKLQAAVKHVGLVQETENGDNEEYSLVVSLRRASCFSSEADLSKSSEEVFGICLELLQEFEDLDSVVKGLALQTMFLSLLWSYKALDAEAPDGGALATLAAQRRKALEQLLACMEAELASWPAKEGSSQLSIQVVEMLSDIWTLFSEAKLRGTKLQRLGYAPPEDVLKKYWQLCERLLNVPEEGGEDDEEPTEATLSKDAVVVAAAKLAVYALVPKEFLVPEIVSHYVHHGKGVAETVKSFIGRLKQQQASPLEQGELYLEAMKRAYLRHRGEPPGGDDSGDGAAPAACRELAARLSASFTFASRAPGPVQAILKRVVNGGVDFALQGSPRQLPFLEACVLPFATKLSPDALHQLLRALEERVEGIDMDQDPATWRPYLQFTNQLHEKISRKDGAEAAPRPRGRPPKARKAASEEEEEEAEGDDGDDGEEDEEAGSPRSAEEEEVPLQRPARKAQQRGRPPHSHHQQQQQQEPARSQGDTQQRRGAANGTRFTQTQQDTEAATAPVQYYSRKRKGAGAAAAASPATTAGAPSGSTPDEVAEPAGRGEEDAELVGAEEMLYGGSFEATEEMLPGGGRASKRSKGAVLPDTDSIE